MTAITRADMALAELVASPEFQSAYTVIRARATRGGAEAWVEDDGYTIRVRSDSGEFWDYDASSETLVPGGRMATADVHPLED